MGAGIEIRNEANNPIVGTNVQVGIVHGDVMVKPDAPDELATAARRLAGEVRALSARELRNWGIRGQDALPVRWDTAAPELFDYWEKIQADADPVPLAGQFSTIRTTFEAVGSRRLVILGRAGAGKTVLAHRLILDLIEDRGHTDPVPVLFSLSDWNPETDLAHWLAERLVRDFPLLDIEDAATGKRLAELFVDRGLVLPVLDGFDEIPEQRYRDAIRQISALDLPLIVTSRQDQYTEASRGFRAIGGAAAIQLHDLTLDEAHHYLRQSTGKHRASAWDAVFARLRAAAEESASQNLAAVLTTPLMVMLARTAFNDDAPDHDPGELLNTTRFPTTTALRDHLLDAYLRSVYTRYDAGPRATRGPDWTPDQARRWLGHLATDLQARNTHDINWWQLPSTLHRGDRVLLTTAAAGILFGIVFALVFRDAFVFVFGLAFGLAFGIINERRFSRGHSGRRPERLHFGAPQLSRPASPRRSRAEFASGLAHGLLGGLVYGLAVLLTQGLVVELETAVANGVVLGLTHGLISGFTFALTNVVVSALGDTYDPRATAPWTLLDQDRKVTLARMTTAVMFTGIAVGVVMFTPAPRNLAALGLSFGLSAGIARLALSAWGNWLLFTRLWLPLTRRLPWRPKRFLEDAHERGVLRTAGSAYQFRHARLRDHLARKHRN